MYDYLQNNTQLIQIIKSKDLIQVKWTPVKNMFAFSFHCKWQPHKKNVARHGSVYI